ncbi:ribokinase [Lentibacter sp. XHP0401]|jgi:ribokinase|uniref:ribokinase n=1 Tax=Lentibacter sp. XHP0401 TaxID=2984334 RepID=UPI0021E76B71|nr:ribokinase [Lentibacter sp. XHP0401]MCV2892511.1 ribokinase [Lentibacter sp. XHP0401]
MTLFNLGSINLDHFYEVPHLPAPGETLIAESHQTGLGGKGANQSAAAARAGARVVHIGAVGSDGAWAVNRLNELGINTAHISTVKAPTAHAIINVDPAGENAIVVFSGANMKQSLTQLKAALLTAKRGDMLLLQNETNLALEAATLARSLGLKVVYSAAPFNAGATKALLPLTDLLILNAVEMQQLTEATNSEALTPATIVVTEGSKGGYAITPEGEQRFPAFPVKAVDTTGAGDTFTGYLAAALHEGQPLESALRLAAAASALKVTKKGTADAIPSRADVEVFLAAQT